MYRPLLILASLPIALVAQTTAGDPDRPLGLTPDQASQFLHKVEVIKSEFSSQKKNLNESALSRFRSAAASEAAAVEFYLACHKVVNIDRRPVVPGEKAPDPDDTKWREALLDSMRETAMPAALRLQCAYLALTLEAAAAADRATLIPKLRDYLKQAMSEVATWAAASAAAAKKNDDDDRKNGKSRVRRPGASPQTELHAILQQSVQGSLFARAYNLNNYVDKLTPWSYAPLDLEVQYEQVIMPHFQASDVTQLPAIWDEFISLSSNLRQASSDEAAFLMWGQTGYKSLLWRKWTTLLKGGVNSSNAANELVALIQENPTHPSIRAWVDDLTQLAAAVTGEPPQK